MQLERPTPGSGAQPSLSPSAPLPQPQGMEASGLASRLEAPILNQRPSFSQGSLPRGGAGVCHSATCRRAQAGNCFSFPLQGLLGPEQGLLAAAGTTGSPVIVPGLWFGTKGTEAFPTARLGPSFLFGGRELCGSSGPTTAPVAEEQKKANAGAVS